MRGEGEGEGKIIKSKERSTAEREASQKALLGFSRCHRESDDNSGLDMIRRLIVRCGAES
jgi:hypothetical protein